MTTKIIIPIACIALGLAGCATRASSVAPVSVSANDYSAVACDDLRGQLTTARTREAALSKKQNNAAVADAAGVFLLLLPLGSVFGADVSGDLAQAKGETLAIERQIRTKCNG